jgi:hypothetical protein
MRAKKTAAINPIGMMKLPGSFRPTLGPQEVLMWRRLDTHVDHEPSVLDHSSFHWARNAG